MSSSPATPDTFLAHAAAGDSQALERLYASTVDGLYASIYARVSGDRAVTEDAVHDTYTLALDRLGDFEADRGSVASWLASLSRNVVRRHLQTRRRSRGSGLTVVRADGAQGLGLLDGAPLSDEVLARRETRATVNVVLEALSLQHQTLLTDKYLLGRTLSEMADDRQITPQAAKSLLARARASFREAFESQVSSKHLAPRPASGAQS
ncbi:MAG: RNA polymerase sigma-70 factor (ECF subfamily) [Myxococcota bacterium]|jgi:RNA polymerase sigma-70 factor (ECF subfamily)